MKHIGIADHSIHLYCKKRNLLPGYCRRKFGNRATEKVRHIIILQGGVNRKLHIGRATESLCVAVFDFFSWRTGICRNDFLYTPNRTIV